MFCVLDSVYQITKLYLTYLKQYFLNFSKNFQANLMLLLLRWSIFAKTSQTKPNSNKKSLTFSQRPFRNS